MKFRWSDNLVLVPWFREPATIPRPPEMSEVVTPPVDDGKAYDGNDVIDTKDLKIRVRL